ncbi:MAG: hypothetical protein KDA61_12685 [Planctomycetales bacterium]|nr:hypothetical protein [Planctomycetales bacterium]
MPPLTPQQRFSRFACVAIIAAFPATIAATATGTATAPPEKYTAVPAHIRRFVRSVCARYDDDGDGALQQDEWRKMPGQPQRIDRDGDLIVTEGEYQRYVLEYASTRRIAPLDSARGRATAWETPPSAASGVSNPTASKSTENPPAVKTYHVPERFRPQGLPPWFVEADVDGDGQVSLAEFAPRGEAQRVAQFERLDANRDGLLTSSEALRSDAAPSE